MSNSDNHNDVSLGASYKEILMFGQILAESLEYNPKDPITKYVEFLGGKLKYIDPFVWAIKEEEILVEGPCNFTIYTHTLMTRWQFKFTTAHCIGHYVLHSIFGQKNIPLTVKLSGYTRQEWEASHFAASFLMPYTDFKEKYFEYKGDVDKLATYYDLSLETVAAHKEQLIKQGMS